jgi:uncharacterized oligopeptide transporter (OPT) family protein
LPSAGRGPLVLGLGTALVGIGYLVAGASVSFVVLVGALIPGGLGWAVQNPIYRQIHRPRAWVRAGGHRDGQMTSSSIGP